MSGKRSYLNPEFKFELTKKPKKKDGIIGTHTRSLLDQIGDK